MDIINTLTLQGHASMHSHLQNELDFYLEQITRYDSDIGRTHKQILRSYFEWEETRLSDERYTAASIAEYIHEQITNIDEKSLGEVVTLEKVIGSFYAYYRKQRPKWVSNVIGNRLVTHNSETSVASELVRGPYPVDHAINDFRNFLINEHYGTREEAITTVIIDTRATPQQIISLNVSDINHDLKTAKMPLSSDELLVQADLLRHAILDLPDTTFDTITAYLNNERISPSGNESDALFSTRNGRVAESTLRKSFRKLAEEAAEQAGTDSHLYQYLNDGNPMTPATIADRAQSSNDIHIQADIPDYV